MIKNNTNNKEYGICFDIKLQYYVKYAIIIMYKKQKQKKEGNIVQIPKEGNFWQEEGSVYAINDVTGDEVIFYEANDINIVIRSMVEEDINKVSKGQGIPTRKKKILENMLKADRSEHNFIMLEEALIDEPDGSRKALGNASILENGDIEVMEYVKGYNPQTRTIIGLRILCATKKLMEKMKIRGEIKIYQISKK